MPSAGTRIVNGLRFTPLAPWITMFDSFTEQTAFTSCLATVIATSFELFGSPLPFTLATFLYSPAAVRARSHVHETDWPAVRAALGPPLMLLHSASLKLVNVCASS